MKKFTRKNSNEEAKNFYDKYPYGTMLVINKLKLAKEIRGKKVLDVGCGAGRMFFEYMFMGAEVTGLDRSKSSLDFIKEQCKQLNIKPNLVLADLENTNLPSDYFDFIFSTGVLHHTKNPLNALKEFKRIIKPNGKIRIMVYHKHSLENLQRIIVQKLGLSLILPKKFKKVNELWDRYENPLWRTFSEKEMRKLCSQAGLKITKVYKETFVLTTVLELFSPPIINSIVNRIFSRYGWHLLLECEK